MEGLFSLMSPLGAVLMDLGVPFGYAVGVVALGTGLTTAAATALFRR